MKKEFTADVGFTGFPDGPEGEKRHLAAGETLVVDGDVADLWVSKHLGTAKRAKSTAKAAEPGNLGTADVVEDAAAGDES